MPKRAGRRAARKRNLIKKIQEAMERDELAKARQVNRPKITLDTLLPVNSIRFSKPRTSGSDSSDQGVLGIHPEELTESWSPDEFDREYFRRWARENSDDDDVIMLEDFPPIEKEERAFEAIWSRDRQEKKGAEVSRAIVPTNIRNHWLKTKSRLNLSLPFI